MLKKIAIGFFLLFSYSYSYAIDFSVLPSRELSCPAANKNATIYIPNGQNTFSTRISDVFWHPQDRFIANAGTLAKLWTVDNSLVSGCTTSPDWQKVSDVVPGNNERTVAISSICTFNKPTNISNTTLQFVFNIRHGAIGGGTTNVTRYYYPESGWFNSPVTRLSKNYTNYRVSDYQVHGNECLNITLAWCGDGIPDSTNGESCDLGLQNGQPGSACSATCTPPPPPTTCIPGSATGPRPAAVTQATPNLCPAGQIVGNFAGLGIGPVTNYIWSCNGSIPGGACAASFTAVGAACIPGTTTGPQPSTVTATTPSLCPANQTVGDFTPVVAGAVTNYSWSCAGSFTGSVAGGTCTASSPSVVALCIPGSISGPQPAAITATTPGLCLGGSASVSGFLQSTVGAVTSYIWSCDGSAAGGACSASSSATIIVIPPPPPGGGGNTCTPGNFVRDSGNVVPATIVQTTPGLCPPNEVVGNFVDTPNGGVNRKYSWSCNTISAGLACTAYYNGVTGFTPPGGSNTIPGANSYCGNGAIERPNAAGQFENCDTTASWCTDQYGKVICDIAETTPGAVVPGYLTITTPGQLPQKISLYNLIIGNGVPVFSLKDTVSFHAGYPMYLSGITATITNKSKYISGAKYSMPITGGVGGALRTYMREQPEVKNASGVVITPWTITYREDVFPTSIDLFEGKEVGLQNFKGKTTDIPVGDSSADTDIRVPMSIGSGLYATLQYLEAPFNIRVSKPVISNSAGGSAYVGSFLGYSVNNVVDSFMNNLKSGNFTTSTVNIGSASELSSATSTVSGNAWLNQVISSGSTSEASNITRSSINGSSMSMSSVVINNIGLDSNTLGVKMGDNNNIRVISSGDAEIGEALKLKGVKTIIVENGNLVIDKNISYSDTLPVTPSSYAFIVKNGNIVIGKDVTNIAGVYVTLSGAIMSDGNSTPNRLTVEGSLYGNTKDLVDNRTYVRGQTGYSALNVGVVVNYSNRAIMYPPPFLSRFLDQYSLQRVSR